MENNMLVTGLYTILEFEQQEDMLVAKIKLDKEHRIFKGHFPGNPVMPGVCMIQIIKELTEKAVGKELFLAQSSNIKFMAIINPEKNDVLTLNLQLAKSENEVKVKTLRPSMIPWH